MIKFFIVGVVFLTAAWLGLRWVEPKILYFPDPHVIAVPSEAHLAYENVAVKTSAGKVVTGWFIPGTPAHFTVLLCHGNAGNISHRIDKAARLHHVGLNVVLFDYEGYGQSPGAPSEIGTYADADAMITYLTEARKIPANRIIYYGESLGAAVAVEMSRCRPAAGLILESPFTSTVAMAHKLLPFIPAQWTIKNRYDNLSKISTVHMPLLILHSPQDEVIPFRMGQALFTAANEPKTFAELLGGHNDGYITAGPRYLESIEHFLKTLSMK